MYKKILVTLATFFAFLNICYGEGITVGTIERQPFVIETENGLTGFSIELWEEIAKQLDLNFEYKIFTVFADMLKETEFNQVDLSAANISITSSREKIMDFSGPIFDSGISMMIKKENLDQKGLIDFIQESHYGITLILSLFFLSWGFFFITKKKFKKEFYAASVIYLLLFVGVGMYDYTSFKLESEKESTYNLTSLHNKEIGAILGSTGEDFLNSLDIKHRHYKVMDELYLGLKNDDIEVIIHDLPILQYYTSKNPEYLVVGDTFRKEQYGILFPQESKIKEKINIALLEIRSSGKYEEIYTKYFGEY